MLNGSHNPFILASVCRREQIYRQCRTAAWKDRGDRNRVDQKASRLEQKRTIQAATPILLAAIPAFAALTIASLLGTTNAANPEKGTASLLATASYAGDSQRGELCLVLEVEGTSSLISLPCYSKTLELGCFGMLRRQACAVSGDGHSRRSHFVHCGHHSSHGSAASYAFYWWHSFCRSLFRLYIIGKPSLSHSLPCLISSCIHLYDHNAMHPV